jgi:tRNA pseudouridine13 synthase
VVTDLSSHVTPTRYLTHEVPGVGGVVRERPEDFLVDEVPLYEPAGAGEHLYMLVEKKNMATSDLIQIVAKHFGVPRHAVGYAGLKDRLAVTRQVLSVHVPGKKIEDFPMLQHERVGVLWADYHANKLRQGHLRGNRFSIRIRKVNPMHVALAKKVLDRLAVTGVPNRFGEQRFGTGGSNHLFGRALVLGDYERAVSDLFAPFAGDGEKSAEARRLAREGKHAEALAGFPRGCRTERALLVALAKGASAERAVRSLDLMAANFMVSAFQSAAFNHVLDRRLAAGTIGSLRGGDVAMKHENRAMFAVDDATSGDAATTERLAAFEISPTGPMWGPAMMRAAGATEAEEVEALADFGVTPEQVAAFGTRHPRLIEGARRPLRVPIIDPDVEGGVDEHGTFIRVVFELPRGSFATVVLREIMKPTGRMEDEE